MLSCSARKPLAFLNLPCGICYCRNPIRFITIHIWVHHRPPTPAFDCINDHCPDKLWNQSLVTCSTRGTHSTSSNAPCLSVGSEPQHINALGGVLSHTPQIAFSLPFARASPLASRPRLPTRPKPIHHTHPQTPRTKIAIQKQQTTFPLSPSHAMSFAVLALD